MTEIREPPFSQNLIRCTVVRYPVPTPMQLAEGTELKGIFDEETGCLLSMTDQEFEPAVWLENADSLTQQQRDQQLLEIDHYIKNLTWSLAKKLPEYGGTLVDVLKRLASLRSVSGNPVLAPRISAIVTQFSHMDPRIDQSASKVPIANTQEEQYISLAIFLFLSVFATGERALVFSNGLVSDTAIALSACELWALLHLAVPRFNQLFRRVFSSCFALGLVPHAYQYKTAEELGIVTWEALGQYATITMLAIKKTIGQDHGIVEVIMRGTPSVLAGATIADMQTAATKFDVSPLAVYITKSLFESEAVFQYSMKKKESQEH
jgi:hypothetical protein